MNTNNSSVESASSSSSEIHKINYDGPAQHNNIPHRHNVKFSKLKNIKFSVK